MKTILTIMLIAFALNCEAQIFSTDSVKIIKEVDKYTGEKTFSTGFHSGYCLSKLNNNDSSFYSLNLRTFGYTAVVDGKGVYIMFDNGQVYIDKDAKISVEAGQGESFDYSAMLIVDSKLLNLLKSNYMISYKLYIYDHNLDCGQSEDEFIKQGYTPKEIKKILDERKTMSDIKMNNFQKKTELVNKNFPLFVMALINSK